MCSVIYLAWFTPSLHHIRVLESWPVDQPDAGAVFLAGEEVSLMEIHQRAFTKFTQMRSSLKVPQSPGDLDAGEGYLCLLVPTHLPAWPTWATPGSVCRKLNGSRIRISSHSNFPVQILLVAMNPSGVHTVSQELGRMIDFPPLGLCGPKSVPLEPKVCAGVAKVNLIQLYLRGIFTIKCLSAG